MAGGGICGVAKKYRRCKLLLVCVSQPTTHLPRSSCHFLPHTPMAHHSNGAFGLIPAALRPATQRVGLSGGRRRLRTATATLVPSEILGGLTVVSGLVANGTFTLPAVTGATGLVALGGLRNGDRVDYVLQNNSVNPAGTATLAIDGAATFTMYGPLVVPAGSNSLHVRIIMNSATTALCYTSLVDPAGRLTIGAALFSYLDINQNAATGSTSAQGTYVALDNGALVTEAQLLSGYTYVANGAGNNLILPGAVAVANALLAKGITAAAGLRLPPIVVVDTVGAGALTVTPGAGVTVHGTAAITNMSATVHWVFSGAATAVAIVVQGA